MTKFRKTIFWIHFVAGLVAGAAIFVMCVTGAVLAFERNLIDIADGQIRFCECNGSESALVSRIIESARTAAPPEAKPASVTAYLDSDLAWQVNFGRGEVVYVNPVTADVTGKGSSKMRQTMEYLRELHRYLAFREEMRPIGKAITGAGNLLFVLLCVSGIYIWAPRIWEWRRIRPKIWFRRTNGRQARDFNWHNTIGFWSSVFLLGITITATVISYKWAADLLTLAVGGSVIKSGLEQGRPQKEDKGVVPAATIERAFETARAFVPNAKAITIRLPASETVEFSVDEGVYFNRFARSALAVSTTSGEVVKWEPYSESDVGRRARSWFRFTHTGEIFGLPGQIVAAIASLGGALLVWTGFAMAFRRIRNLARSRHR